MPHLRTLVERYDGRPFAVLGVNTGDDEQTFRDGVEKYKVSWISAFQGADSPIADAYRVEGYPTYLIIDHEGKIRLRAHGVDDDMIAKLVEAAEAAPPE